MNVRRANFKSFWDKYSDKPDTNSMMLNHSAEELESSDRADILASLPLLHNKDVVDIGAGIGLVNRTKLSLFPAAYINVLDIVLSVKYHKI